MGWDRLWGRVPGLLAFAGAFALVLVFALRGGSYDIVVRQEHALVIWWLLAVGVALGLLPRSRPPGPVLILLGALACYAAWTALSLTWTESSERTFAEVARVLSYIGLVALVSSALDRRTWRPAGAGLMFGALTVCGLAIWSRLAPASFPVDTAAKTFAPDRLDYPFGYWNAVGAWGAITAALALSWSSHDRLLVRRALALGLVPVAALMTYLSYSRAGGGAIVLAVLIVPALSRNRITATIHAVVAAAATGFVVLAVRGAPQIAKATGTRGAASVLGALAFAGVVCAAVAVLTRVIKIDRRRVPRSIARRLALLAAIPVVLLAGAFGPHLARKAWHSFRHTGLHQTSNPTSRLTNLSGTRYDIWRVALKGFAAHPVTGTGAGTYEFFWNRHQRNSEFVRNAHSLWLENLEELGLPGGLLIVAVAAACILVAVRARLQSRRGATAGAATAATAAFFVYLLNASVDWMWQSTAVTVLALAGVAAVGSRSGGGRPRVPWPVRGAVALLAVGAAAVQVPGLLATTEIRRSQAAAATGNLGAALAWARDAVSAEPWAASGYMQRGLVLESEGRLGEAARDVGKAISHERTNFAGWVVLARIDTERGNFDAALNDLSQARKFRTRGQAIELSRSFGKP